MFVVPDLTEVFIPMPGNIMSNLVDARNNGAP
jgi:hypothetical protein